MVKVKRKEELCGAGAGPTTYNFLRAQVLRHQAELGVMTSG